MISLYPSLKFDDTLKRFGLADAMRRAGTVITAYSGGADSSCLLHHLLHWCRDNGVTLAAAHVNHQIRGEDADRDEQFCRETCGKMQIPLYVLREDVPALAAQSGRGLEETARNVRYTFFDRVSEELTGSPDAAVVATAHNADDHLETVVFNLLRGSGTRGLSGIDPLRDGRFVRPLICDTGEEIRQWCADHHIPYMTDATNADTDYTRNFIRHNIVPQMEKICGNPQRAALRMSSLLRQDDDFLEQTAAQYVSGDSVSVPRGVLAGLHPAVASRVILHLYGNAVRTASGSSSLEEIHIREILRLTDSDAAETSLSLPGNIRFTADRHTVRFRPNDETVRKPEDGIVFTYPDDGDVFENERYVIKFSHENHTNNVQEEENIYKLFICRTFCFDKIKDVLYIRYRRPGDTCVFGGMTRKVKKLFIDRKLTAEEKSTLPLILSGGDILWIPLFPPRDGVLANGNEPGLTIAFYEKKTF